MSRDIQIRITGNIAAEPELRFTPNGNAVCDFRILVNRQVRNDDGDWTNASPRVFKARAWGDLAERAAESFQTGDRVWVDARDAVPEAWIDRRTGEAVAVIAVTVTDFGLSILFNCARSNRTPREHRPDTTTPTEPTTPPTDDQATEQPARPAKTRARRRTKTTPPTDHD